MGGRSVGCTSGRHQLCRGSQVLLGFCGGICGEQAQSYIGHQSALCLPVLTAASHPCQDMQYTSMMRSAPVTVTQCQWQFARTGAALDAWVVPASELSVGCLV